MIQLRHLKTKAVITEIPPGDDEGCKNLQSLGRILSLHGNLADLFNTKSLGLGKLNQLEKLKLVNDVAVKEMMCLPESGWFPPNLKMMTIAGAKLDSEQLSKLARIETLQVLKLKNIEFPEKKLWRVDPGGFRILHFLLIEETNVVSWSAPNDSFPSLRNLVLSKCNEIQEIPDGAAEGLEKLNIEHLGKSAVASAKKIEGDKKQNQVQHRAARSGGGFKLSMGAGCV